MNKFISPFLLLLIFPSIGFALDLSGTWKGNYKTADNRTGKLSLVLTHTDNGYAATLNVDDKKCQSSIPKKFTGTTMQSVVNLISQGNNSAMFSGEYKNKQLEMVMMLTGVPSQCSPFAVASYEIKLKR